MDLIRKTVLAGLLLWMAAIGLASCGGRIETEETKS